MCLIDIIKPYEKRNLKYDFNRIMFGLNKLKHNWEENDLGVWLKLTDGAADFCKKTTAG